MKLGVGLVLTLCFLVMISSASALTEIDSCQTLTNASETYQLNASIVDSSSGGSCINASADGIILDCDGFTINGSSVSDGLYFTNNNILVRNCVIEYFVTGVSFNGDNATLLDSIVRNSNTRGIEILSQTTSLIDNVTSLENGNGSEFDDAGIHLQGSNNAVVNNSVITDSGSFGIYTWNFNTLAIYNTDVDNSGKEGIMIDSLGGTVTIINVNINGTTANGNMRLDGTDNILVRDTIVESGYNVGIYAYQTSNVILDNITSINAGKPSGSGDGIAVSESDNITIINSNVVDSDCRAIHLGWVNNTVIENVTLGNDGSHEGLWFELEVINVTVDNLHVSRGSQGASFNSTTNAVINNANFTNATFSGVLIWDSTDITMTNINSSDNGNEGFKIDGSGSNITLSNIIANNNYDYGFYESYDGSLIVDNAEFRENGYPSRAGMGITTSNNYFYNILVADSESVYEILINGTAQDNYFENITIDSDGVNGQFGIFCESENATGNEFHNVTIFDALGRGINFRYVSDIVLDDVEIYNSQYGLYMKDVVDVLVDGLESHNNSYYGAYVSTSAGVNLTNSNVYSNEREGVRFYSPSGVNRVTNTVINDSYYYGISATSIEGIFILEDVNVTRGDGNATYYSDFYLVPTNEANCTGISATDSYGSNDELYYFVNSAETLDGISFSHMQLCDADGTNITNINFVGDGFNGIEVQDTDGLIIDNVVMSNSTFPINIVTSSNVDISNLHITDSDDVYFATVTNLSISDSFITNLYVPSQNLMGSLYIVSSNGDIVNLTFTTSVDGDSYYDAVYFSGSTFEITDSSFTGANSTLGFDGTTSNNIDLYNSDIVRTESTAGYGALTLYCSAEPCGNNTVNLYETNFTDYSVTNSTLSIYWQLLFTNTDGARIQVYDAEVVEVYDFTDVNKNLWLREYYVTPTDTVTNSTPHDIYGTKAGYDTGYIALQMSSSGSYNMDLLSSGTESSLTEAGAGLGGFMTAITEPTVDLIMSLGFIGGILIVIFAIVSIFTGLFGQISAKIK